MLTANDGTNYQPVVVDVLNSSNSGFSVAPYCDTEAEKVYFKTSSDGYISYYFSRSSSTSGLTEDFNGMYEYTSGEYKGSFSVKGGQLDYIDFSKIDTKRYPYIIVMFTDKSGNDYMPSYVDLNKNSSPSGVGFTIYSISNGKIRLAVDTDGTLRYKQVERDGDSTGYWSSSQSVSKGDIITIPYDVNGGKYMALWLDNLPATYIDLTGDYSRDDDPDDGSNTRGTGFRSVDRTLNGTTLDVTFTPDVDGTVYFSSSASGLTGESKYVTAGSQYSMSFDVSAYLKYEGITGSITITMQLTSGSKIYERVTLLDTSK